MVLYLRQSVTVLWEIGASQTRQAAIGTGRMGAQPLLYTIRYVKGVHPHRAYRTVCDARLFNTAVARRWRGFIPYQRQSRTIQNSKQKKQALGNDINPR